MDGSIDKEGYQDRDSRDKKRERADRPASRAQAGIAGAAHAANGRHGDARALRQLRRGSGAGFRSEWPVSSMPRRSALLQAVRSLRHRQAVRVHAADSRANRQERRQEQLHVLRVSHDRREGHIAGELRHQHARRCQLRRGRTTRAKPSKISSRSSLTAPRERQHSPASIELWYAVSPIAAEEGKASALSAARWRSRRAAGNGCAEVRELSLCSSSAD